MKALNFDPLCAKLIFLRIILNLLYIFQKQYKAASDFLANEMGQTVNRASKDKIPINLTKDEIQLYIKRFQIIDKDNKGYVSINDIRRGLKVRLFELLRWTLVSSSSSNSVPLFHRISA